jgi:hypothetical protein
VQIINAWEVDYYLLCHLLDPRNEDSKCVHI